ncbi:hypothetical protein [Calidithermus roseus]|uniref:Lipoprotein n=1 Tax=Calidithermus roseus TaxID=1644118 RepID=A0A399EUC0_9DEIN|nr:hypothetical protein [Calidithermus roseus]RIH88214.1 hypothetical protein Mrose_00943 [Calidithermus roseus]
MKLDVWSFSGLLVLLAGCQPWVGSSFQLIYAPSGVCSALEFTDYSGLVSSITNPSGDELRVSKGQPVQLQAKSSTTYNVGYGPVIATATVELDLEFRCLPDKPPVRGRYRVNADKPSERLKVSENAATPSGLEIVFETYDP